MASRADAESTQLARRPSIDNDKIFAIRDRPGSLRNVTGHETIERVAGWLRESSSTVVLTGAGISTESGIPDFRGPQGLWTKNPAAERTATIQHYLANREARVRSWQSRIGGSTWADARPNAGHLALADLERKGKLDTLVTQNIDSLHLKAGSSQAHIIEIHGTVRDFVCVGCGERGPIERVLDRVRGGEDDPPCRTCGGILKSATISFGQNLVREDLERAEQAAARCEVFLAVGTSLTVYPVALLPEMALRNGARLVILNAQETPYDQIAHEVISEQIGDALPRIVAEV
jgi:NAD-dependent deacetylase